MSAQNFEHPSIEKAQEYLECYERVNKPFNFLEAKSSWKIIGLTTAFSTALFYSFVWNRNPVGSNVRFTYEKRLTPASRYARRFGPLAIIMSGLVYLDTERGIW